MHAQASGEPTVLESSLLQDPISLLLRWDVPHEAILHSIRTIAEIAHASEPVLLYFSQSQVEDALRAICARRGTAWQEFHIRRLNDTPFAKSRSVTGFEGLLRFWREHHALTEQLVEEFRGPKLILDRSTGHWASDYRDIAAFLSLPFVEDPAFPEMLLNTYVGTYTYREEWSERRVREFTLQRQGQALALHDFPWLWPGNRLLPKARHLFYAEAWPFECLFDEDVSGTIQCMRIGHQRVSWGGIEQVFPKVR
jgi:hypothetical protein